MGHRRSREKSLLGLGPKLPPKPLLPPHLNTGDPLTKINNHKVS